MSRDRGRALNLEDRILWSKVAGSVNPLPGRSVPKVAEEPEPAAGKGGKPEAPSSSPTLPKVVPAGPPSPGALDRMTRRKLAKGRLPIEGKLDLHGLTQSDAHALLLSFLHQARDAGRRHVLVVTGKGSSSGSEGVLRRVVPQWLGTGVFRGLVSAYEDAGRPHGGYGAIYVRLRRLRGPPS